VRAPGTVPGGVLDWSVFADFVAACLPPDLVRRGAVGWEGEAGTQHVVVTAGQDVELHVTTSDGFELTARLAAPGGVWRVPAIGEEVMLFAPAGDWRAPGGPVAVAKHREPPSSLTATRAVVEVPSGGLLIGNGATKAAARTDDPILPGTVTVAPQDPLPNAPSAGLVTVPVLVTYTAPDEAPVVCGTLAFVATAVAALAITGSVTINLGGKVGPGSDKVRIE